MRKARLIVSLRASVHTHAHPRTNSKLPAHPTEVCLDIFFLGGGGVHEGAGE